MVVESVELVVAALGAGAAAGASDTASAAVKDAYSGLKSLVLKALRRGGRDEEQLPERLDNPAEHRDELVAALTTVDAGADTELMAAAKTVLQLTGHIDQRGKYIVDLHDNKGVQVGDGNTMTINFNE